MPRLPASHAYMIGLTAAVVVVVVVLLAVPAPPQLSENDRWTSFRATLPPLPPGVPRDVAALDHPGVPLSPGSEWLVSATRASNLGTHVHHVQAIDGRPVLGSFATEHRLPGGSRRVEGRATTLSRHDAPRAPAVAGDRRAIETARAAAGVTSLRAPVSTLAAYYPTAGALLPVLEVTIPANHPLGDWVVVLNEWTHEILLVEDRLSLAEGEGRAFPRVPDVACQTGPNADDDDLEPFIDTVALTHLTGTGYLDGAFVRTLNGGRPRANEPDARFWYKPSHDGFEQVMVYFTITRYFGHLESLGVDGYGGSAIVADAHGYEGDNSFYSPATGQLSFGDGGVPDGQDPEIILHELGHALHHRAQPSYAHHYGSRVISEGISDYIACSFFDEPKLAEWDAAAYSSACPPYLRRLDVMRHYPEDLTGAVHADGLVWGSALWAVRAEIGSLVTDRLLLESLFLLPADAGPRAAALALLEADAILTGGEHRDAMHGVFAERGLVEGGPSDVAPPVRPIFARAVPNPFRTRATVRFVLPESGRVRVDVVDVTGRLTATLFRGYESAGSHAISWDGRDENGRPAPAGVYVYHVMSGDRSASGRIVRIR